LTPREANESGEARIAVIIPCYREGDLVLDAVHSVREHEPIELVVVDDGSDDEPTQASLERLESDGVRVVRHDRNRGLSAARSTGLEVTRAPYVFPLDSDDLAVPYVLGQMANRLDEHPEAAVCYGDYVEFGGLERIRAVPTRIDPFRLAYTNEYPASALFRRNVLEGVGGWTPIEAYEDWHLWMTLAERGMTGLHFGFGLITYRRRLGRQRMLAKAKAFHPRLYARLRADHPRLFNEVAVNRRRSRLHPARKRLYPIIYGSRARFSWEYRVKAVFERLRVWRMQR
jgi:glycosyltransferase involved in cell wall biosynthesis